MIATLRTIALRIALCAALTWATAKLGFNTGVVFMAALFAVALARPLLDLASDLRHEFRRTYWRDVQGRYYAFRGRPISVLTDADHRRWLCLPDVRRAIGFTASDATLQVAYPAGFRRLGRGAQPHLAEDALLAHLSKERSPAAVKFCGWLEREIAFPARRERERLGIKLPPPDAQPSE